jgi:hypothetical protein
MEKGSRLVTPVKTRKGICSFGAAFHIALIVDAKGNIRNGLGDFRA